MEALNLPDSLIAIIQDKVNSAVATLVNRPITLTIEHHGIIQIPEVHNRVSQMSGQVTTVYIPLTGEVYGDIFLFLPGSSAPAMADLMLNNPAGTTKVISEFESSALKEMGNITSGSIVTELANSLHLSMMLTTPNLATDMPGALVDQVLIQYGEISNDLLAIELSFSIPDNEVSGSFFLLFDQESSETIRGKIGELHL
jgi:chemotaxis protein CheC